MNLEKIETAIDLLGAKELYHLELLLREEKRKEELRKEGKLGEQLAFNRYINNPKTGLSKCLYTTHNGLFIFTNGASAYLLNKSFDIPEIQYVQRRVVSCKHSPFDESRFNEIMNFLESLSFDESQRPMHDKPMQRMILTDNDRELFFDEEEISYLDKFIGIRDVKYYVAKDTSAIKAEGKDGHGIVLGLKNNKVSQM